MVRLFMCFSKQSKSNRRRRRNTMPCTNCMAEYTRSRKEHGCSKCGFGFCDKCLNQKVLIPALSPKPVSVCASCYNQQQANNDGKNPANPREKNRHFPLPSSDQPQQQSWRNGGGGELPPPSLRSLYTTQAAAARRQQQPMAGAGGSRADNNKEWSELEARLQRLNEPIVQDQQPQQQQPSAQGQAGKSSGSSNGHGKSGGGGQTIAQLEERLAALRGLPVDVIRKPRLLVTNEEDDEDMVVLNDDAQALLRQAEAGIRMDRSVQQQQQQRDVVENESAISSRLSVQADEDDSSSSANSSLVRKTINEVTTEANDNSNSSMSDLSSAASSRAQLYPDFAECIKRTMEDAAVAEQEAIDFLRRHGQGQQAGEAGQIAPQNRGGNGGGTGEAAEQSPTKSSSKLGQKITRFFR